MKPFIEPTEGQTLPTWADIDWHAVEANVGRLQERIYTIADPVLPSLWYHGCCSLGPRSQGEHRPLFLGRGTDRP